MKRKEEKEALKIELHSRLKNFKFSKEEEEMFIRARLKAFEYGVEVDYNTALTRLECIEETNSLAEQLSYYILDKIFFEILLNLCELDKTDFGFAFLFSLEGVPDVKNTDVIIMYGDSSVRLSEVLPAGYDTLTDNKVNEVLFNNLMKSLC